jgi:hypothetical protein
MEAVIISTAVLSVFSIIVLFIINEIKRYEKKNKL